MKINKKVGINILLVTGTFIIWGFIISRIVEHYNSPQENESEIINASEVPLNVDIEKNNIDAVEQRWIQIERDPFHKGSNASRIVIPARNITIENSALGKKKDVQQIVPVKINEQKTNNLLVTGIITTNGSKLAIIIDNVSNKTLFLHSGEMYEGILIKEIRDNSVVINKGSFSKELFVKP